MEVGNGLEQADFARAREITDEFGERRIQVPSFGPGLVAESVRSPEDRKGNGADDNKGESRNGGIPPVDIRLGRCGLRS